MYVQQNVKTQKKGQRKCKICRTVQTADLDGQVGTKSPLILGKTVSIEKKVQREKMGTNAKSVVLTSLLYAQQQARPLKLKKNKRLKKSES